MISWKYSFKRLNEEYEISKKRKQALDNLLNTGRISQQTYDVFNSEISEAMAEIEKQHRVLLEKMSLKVSELEEQIKNLEVLLANFEIQHVTGEVDDETYQREIGVLSIGLETARKELDVIKEAMSHISSSLEVPEGNIVQKESEQSQEVSNVEVEVVEAKTEGQEQASTTVAEQTQQ